MMKMIKYTGWVILSALCFFIVFFFVQWLTFEALDLLLIQNHLVLFALSGLVGFAFQKWYGLIGAVVLVVFLLFLMLLQNNLTFILYSTTALIVLGSASGTCIRRHKYIPAVLTFLLGGLVLWNAHDEYSTIKLVKVSAVKKTDASRFNAISADFVSLDGTKLQLSEDTVYLINFTFYACKPCRTKRPSMELLEKEFMQKPFKLVTVNCLDSIGIFRKYYSDYRNCYRNSNQRVEQKLGIYGYPYEIIFDKNGREVRRFGGFPIEAKDDYEQKTRILIKKLINENN